MYIERSKLKRLKELRAMSRENLRGNWGNAILLSLIFMILGSVAVVNIFIYGPLLFGFSLFFIKLTRNDNPELETLFDGFRLYAKTLVLSILIWIFTFLWTLLFFIPGIIAMYRYSMAYYIMTDNPEINAQEALRRSKFMMKGQKGRLFLLHLSFIGWIFLCLLSAGIGFLWLGPYISTANANFYNDLKQAME